MNLYSSWYQTCETETWLRAEQIKLLICDIDGVFSDGTVYLGNHGEELKGFNTKDGFGIKALQKAGVIVAVITGRKSVIVEKRMKSLGVAHVFQGMEDKIIGYEQLKSELNLTDQQVAYIGDDFPDVKVMTQVGLAVAVADAHPYVREIAHHTTSLRGGYGAVRELTDLLIEAQQGSDYLVSGQDGVSL